MDNYYWQATQDIVATLRTNGDRNGKQRIVIYGGSFFLAGIGECLKQNPDFEVFIIPASARAVDIISALQPDVVLAEQDMTPALLPLLCPPQNLPIIGLGTQQSVMTVLRGDSYQIEALTDLVALIEHISVSEPQIA